MSPSTGSAPRRLARRRRTPGPPRDHVKARLVRLYEALERRFGPQRWWPGRTPYEVAVGAVLTQHTAWTNAARAVAALRAQCLLRPRRLAARGEAEVARAIRAAGTPRVKARRLRALTWWLLDRFGGAFAPLRRLPLAPLRRELLAVPGIGPETADAILLYAAARPVLVRHRLLRRGAGYDEARAFLEARLPSDPVLFNEFHALLVRVGKTHCRTVPRCEGCPLRFDLQ